MIKLSYVSIAFLILFLGVPVAFIGFLISQPFLYHIAFFAIPLSLTVFALGGIVTKTTFAIPIHEFDSSPVITREKHKFGYWLFIAIYCGLAILFVIIGIRTFG